MKAAIYRIPLLVFTLGACMILLGSCVSSPQKKENPIIGIAAFDLNCPKDQLSITVIERTIWGVSGCGRRGRYVHVCHRRGMTDECRWILNYDGTGAPI